MAYTPTKRDLSQKIRAETKQLNTLAAAKVGEKISDANFTTWSGTVQAALTADMTAFGTAPA